MVPTLEGPPRLVSGRIVGELQGLQLQGLSRGQAPGNVGKVRVRGVAERQLVIRKQGWISISDNHLKKARKKGIGIPKYPVTFCYR